MKVKVCNIILIFFLTVFLASSDVVTSPSLFYSMASNNVEKVFAKTDNEEQQQQ
jgi:hypothetical protein